MPELVPPTTDLHASFLEALDEFRTEGRLGPGDSTGLGQDARDGIPGLDDPVGFAQYVARVRARALPETPRPVGYVPDTILWFRDGATFLGRISIRHELNELLRDVGGHVGYDVRPSARRRGHATEMLRQALPIARRLGIDAALITCDVTNIGSREGDRGQRRPLRRRALRQAPLLGRAPAAWSRPRTGRVASTVQASGGEETDGDRKRHEGRSLAPDHGARHERLHDVPRRRRGPAAAGLPGRVHEARV